MSRITLVVSFFLLLTVSAMVFVPGGVFSSRKTSVTLAASSKNLEDEAIDESRISENIFGEKAIVINYEVQGEGFLAIRPTDSRFRGKIEVVGLKVPVKDTGYNGKITPAVLPSVGGGESLEIQVTAFGDSLNQGSMETIFVPESRETRKVTHQTKLRQNKIDHLRIEGRYNEARKECKLLLEWLIGLPNARNSHLITNQMAIVSHYYGASLSQHQSVYDSLSIVLDFRNRIYPENHPNILNVKRDIANASYNLGRVFEARSAYDELLPMYQAFLPEGHHNILMILSNKASILDFIRDYQGAKRIMEEVVDYSRQTIEAKERNYQELVKKADLALGVAKAKAKNKANAAILQLVHQRLNHCEFVHQLAGVLSELNEYERALGLLDEAISMIDESLHWPIVNRTTLNERGEIILSGMLNSLGEVWCRLDDYEQARIIWEESLKYSKGEIFHELAIMSNLSNVYRRGKNYGQARKMEEEALKILSESSFGKSGSARSSHVYAKILSNHMQTLALLGDLGALKSAMSRFIEELRNYVLSLAMASSRREIEQTVLQIRSKLSVLINIVEDPRLSSELSEFVPLVFELIETVRGIGVVGWSELRMHQQEPGIGDLFQKLKDVRLRVARLATADGSNHLAYAEVVHEEDALEREALMRLSEIDPESFVLKGLNLGEVKRKLKPHQAIIAYWIHDGGDILEHEQRMTGKEVVSAFVMEKNRPVRLVELGKVERLKNLIESWRSNVERPIVPDSGESSGMLRLSKDPRLLAEFIRREFFDPLKIDSNVRELFIAPDGILHCLPFGILPLDEGYLGERFSLTTYLNLSDFANPSLANSNQDKTLVIFGNIGFDGKRPLPNSRFETKELSDLYREAFKKEPFIFEEDLATYAALKKYAEDAKILHVSTHGFFFLVLG